MAPRDVAASVRARLLHLARERGDDFQLLLTRYANERLLYRLTRSRHHGSFILKGATLFTLWTGRPHRATRNVDLLGVGDPSEDRMRSVFTEVIELDVGNDGVVFDIGSLMVGPIREDQEYGGVRVELLARITAAPGPGDPRDFRTAKDGSPRRPADRSFERVRCRPRQDDAVGRVRPEVGGERYGRPADDDHGGRGICRGPARRSGERLGVSSSLVPGWALGMSPRSAAGRYGGPRPATFVKVVQRVPVKSSPRSR